MNNPQLQEAIDKTRKFILDAQPFANSGPRWEAWSNAVSTLKSLQSAQAQRAVIIKATDEANARANASWTLMCKKMVEQEREACLKICEAQASTNYWEGADVCADAIRARGEQP